MLASFFPLMTVSLLYTQHNLRVANLRMQVELAASFVVWAASTEAAFLKGKFVWANWDVNELIAKKEALEASPQLTIGLIGWP